MLRNVKREGQYDRGVYRLIDQPRKCTLADYEQAIDLVVERLRSCSDVLSVYQIGGISTPGISDIDIVVVFRDRSIVQQDFLSGILPEQRYLLIHSMYGASREQFRGIRDIDLLHGYRLLFGVDEDLSRSICGEEVEALSRQVAYEYLLRMYFVSELVTKYGVLKLRSLLLHVNGLKYDLDFLGVKSGRFFDLINRMIEWRETWFESRPSNEEICEWHCEFSNELRMFLSNQLSSNTFYLPIRDEHTVSNILTIKRADTLEIRASGFSLSTRLSFLGKYYMKARNRFNRFVLEVPFANENVPDVIQRRFELFREMREYNRTHLPHFAPLGSSLHAY